MFSVLNSIYDRLTSPLLSWSAEWSCVLISAIIGIVLLFCFKFVSTQRRIETVKNRMTACILGVWLYRDQPGMIARCQGAILLHGAHYLFLSLLPLVVFAIPMTLILSQMNAWYGYLPIEPGRFVLVTATLDSPTRTAELKPPAGMRVEATHHDPAARQMLWRVACDEAAREPLRIAVDGQEFTKEISVGHGLMRIQPHRDNSGLWSQLLYPSEPPFPANAPVHAISVAYPPRELQLYWWRCHWLWTCFAAMSLAILLMRGPLRVAI